MSLQDVFNVAFLIFKIALITTLVLCIDKIFYIIFAFLPAKKFPKSSQKSKFAILIPARNESKVIESLLQSIEAQTYDRAFIDVFVVIEDENDPTVEICKKYNARVTVRKKLELCGKGYALDELLLDMYENGYKDQYDAYFIFDADNYLSPTYMEKMNDVFNDGYDVGVGYRNNKNWNSGWVASCSALNFSIANSFHNKFNARLNNCIMVTGTGFFINAKIIDSMGGWKFHCLTEDLELSNFAALHNLKSTYCAEAEFFDEQPNSFKVSIKQRTRWLKGYFQAAKIYNKKILASIFREKQGRLKKIMHLTYIVPVITLGVVVAVFAMFSIGLGIYGAIIGALFVKKYIFLGLLLFAYIYLGLLIFCALCLLADLNRMDISTGTTAKTIFLGPIYFAFYAPVFFIALFKRRIKWDPIEHTVDFTMPTDRKDSNI